MDKLLDAAQTGPTFLKRPEIARAVCKAITDGENLGRYAAHAFVVMPNHVHLLVTPHVTARRWLGPLKGYTGYMANKLLRRSGAFWQEESYDHLVRNDRSFDRIIRYIEFNPVSSGLALTPEEFLWSSAAPPERAAAAQKGWPHRSEADSNGL
jgi:REP element-mobilizing transposase RayT